MKRLEGTTVQKFKVEAGEYKIEIERGAPAPVAAPAAPGAPAAPAAPLPFDSEQTERPPRPTSGTRSSRRSSARSTAPRSRARRRSSRRATSSTRARRSAIVEAMKLMNEVKADRSGTIAQFAATDGDWVEFEQPLVYLEPAED